MKPILISLLILLTSLPSAFAQAFTPISEPQRYPQVISTIASLQAQDRANISKNTNVLVTIGVTPGDGLAGLFYWSPTSTAATNLDTFASTFPDGIAVGRWIRVSQPSVSAAGGSAQLRFNSPMFVDSQFCKINIGEYNGTNRLNPAVSMPMARFSGSGITNQNYAVYGCRIPPYIKSSVEITASLILRLTSADAGGQTYHLGFADVASGGTSQPTAGHWVPLTFSGDPSGVQGSLEFISNVTLTGWSALLTAGDYLYLELRRDGANDASTQLSDVIEVSLTYATTQ